jgi:uracil-DNA glycosylase
MNRDHAVRELLAFYLEAGVDAVIGDAPVDRFADPSARAGITAVPPTAAANAANTIGNPGREPPPRPDDRTRQPDARPPMPPPAQAPPPPDVAVMAAREAARTAASLDQLRDILDRFEGCSLRASATRLVFADGNPDARLMLVGEAPGRDEDLEGRPFVGRSGKLLDRMLAAIGMDRTSVYIANVVPWRPPGNRTPTPQESAICLPFVRRQIELVDPDILVCLGNPSTQTLLGTKEGITKTRGRWFAYNTGTRDIRAIPTYHPAFLLRTPLAKRLAWRDLLAIKAALASEATRP